MPDSPFHLGWSLGTVQGRSGRDPKNWTSPDLYLHTIRELERACFDYVVLDFPSASTENPAVISAMIAASTSKIGIVPTLPTSVYHPYVLARILGTLDQVSGGRAGWRVVADPPDRAPSEFLDLADALWNGWEPGAIVGDQDAGVFVDPTRIHRADHRGGAYESSGPLSSGPPPQGRPVIAQAGDPGRFAARYVDTVAVEAHSVEAMKGLRDDIRGRLTELGRDPDTCKILFVVRPFAEAEAGSSGAGDLGLAGPPDTVAARMCELMEDVGGDGFVLSHDAPTRRDIAEVVDGLVPALQRRRAVRAAYGHDHFRDNLLEF